MTNINRGSFFLQWVAAVTVTMTIASIGAFVSMWSVGEMVAQSWGETAGGIVAGAVFGALLGVGLGVGQALVLRSYGIPFVRWLWQTIVAGTMGMAIGFVFMFSLFDLENMPEIAIGLAIALSVGLPIGLVQWQLLKTHVAQAQLWIPICVVTFFIAFFIGLGFEEWVAVGTVAVLAAVVSGAGMVWLISGEQTATVA